MYTKFLKDKRKGWILLHPTHSSSAMLFLKGNFKNGPNSARALRPELACLEAGCTRDQQACFCLLITGVQERVLQPSILPVLATRTSIAMLDKHMLGHQEASFLSPTPAEALPRGKGRENIFPEYIKWQIYFHNLKMTIKVIKYI